MKKKTKQKQPYRYREQNDDCQRGGGAEDRVKKMKGLRSADRKLQNNSGDLKDGLGNTVINVVVIMCGASWVLELPGETLCKVREWLTTVLHT